LTQAALANTGTFYSLVFGLYGIAWLVFYIPIEGLVYKLLNVKSPFKVSLRINIFSALVGVLISIPLAKLAWIESPGFVKYNLLKYGMEKPIDYADHYLEHFKGQLLVIILFYLSSILLEYYRFKKKDPECGLNLKKVFVANTITYSILLGVWYSTTVLPIKGIVHDFKSGELKPIKKITK
jgi:hypothetical protein